MTLILSLDFIAITLLCVTAFIKGFEGTLPLATFLLVLFPNESQITLGGMFDLTTQRLIVVVLIVLYVLMGKKRGAGTDEKARVPHGYLILLLIVWMFVSTINSVVYTTSLKSLLSQVLDFFVPYYIFSKTISKVETVQKIIFAIVAALFVCSIFGALEAYQDWSVISLFPAVSNRFADLVVSADRGTRIRATFGHPILFGAALALTIPLAFYLLTVAKTRSRKTFLWISILLMFMNIYKTGSRGPWIALVLSLGLMLMFSRNQVRKYLVVISLLTATVLIARPGVYTSLADLYVATGNPNLPQGSSYEWRYALYHLAYQKLSQDFPRAVWGYGPESFYFLGWHAMFEGSMVAFLSCDSSVAQYLIETGCVGFLIIAFILTKAAIVAFRNFRKVAAPDNYLSLILFINIVAFCFMMTSVALLGWGQQTYMLWFTVAISSIYPQLVKTEVLPQEEEAPASLAFGHRVAEVSRSRLV